MTKCPRRPTFPLITLSPPCSGMCPNGGRLRSANVSHPARWSLAQTKTLKIRNERNYHPQASHCRGPFRFKRATRKAVRYRVWEIERVGYNHLLTSASQPTCSAVITDGHCSLAIDFCARNLCFIDCTSTIVEGQ